AEGNRVLGGRGGAGPGFCAGRRGWRGKLFPACEEAAAAGGHTKNRAISQPATRGGGGACRPSRPTPAAVPTARKRVDSWTGLVSQPGGPAKQGPIGGVHRRARLNCSQ